MPGKPYHSMNETSLNDVNYVDKENNYQLPHGKRKSDHVMQPLPVKVLRFFSARLAMYIYVLIVYYICGCNSKKPPTG